jgi:hypothetical protein
LDLNVSNPTLQQRSEIKALTHGLFKDSTLTLKYEEELLNKFSVPYSLNKVDFVYKKDKDLQEVFPPRCKLDLLTRRVRLIDILKNVPCSTKIEILDILSYLTHLDYLFVTNIIIYGLIHGLELVRTLLKLGYFTDIQHFMTVAGDLSTIVKRIPYDPLDRKQRYAELGSLTGYLQNNVNDFNEVEEVEKLANAGNQHGLEPENWINNFIHNLGEISTNNGGLSSFIPFETYVKEGLWITSGASSIGKVEWSYDTETGKFKARKNMLLDILTPDELWDIVSNWDGVLRSTAFIKDEVSKRRIAVQSGIESYLHEAWLLKMYGHGFKNWDGITLDETTLQGHIRMSKTIELLKLGKYAFPWDYKSFDHQVQLAEILSILKFKIELVMRIIPLGYRLQAQKFFSKIINSYLNSFVSITVSGKKFVFRVVGGLQSGVRITSIAGNECNSDWTYEAQKIVKTMLGYDPVLMKQIRGDDTALFFDTAVEAYLFRLSYAAINSLGSDAKMGISQNICEFLRNEMSTSGVRGWTNRSIPTLSQRKPWNPQPWSVGSEVGILSSNAYLIERRIQREVPILHTIIKNKWSHHVKQSTNWLHLPTHMGGLGLYPFNGWVPNDKLPLITKPIIRTTNLIPPKPLSWIDLSSDQLLSYHQVDFSNKISTSDIVGPQKYFSREYISKLKSKIYTWEKRPIINKLRKIFKCEPGISTSPYWPKQNMAPIKSINSEFPDLSMFLRQYNLVKRTSQYDKTVKIQSLPYYLSKFYPSTYSRLSELESHGWHRTDALNICLGDIPCEPTKSLHPILTIFVKDSVKRSGYNHWRGRNNIASNLYHVTTSSVDYLLKSPSSRLYMW